MLAGANKCQGNTEHYGTIVRVLAGNYPVETVKKMGRKRLEKLLTNLVQCSHEITGTVSKKKCRLRKPEWWPDSVVFKNPIKLEHEENVTFTLKELVIHCTNFFRNYQQKWLPSSNFWNDENRRGVKRRRSDNHKKSPVNKRRLRPLLESRSKTPDRCQQLKPAVKPRSYSPPNSTKIEFLQYFALGKKPTTTAPPISYVSKLCNYTNIPFSSDIGKIMASRENHQMPYDLKLRRLERSEWYTNKVTPKTNEIDYDSGVVQYKEPIHSHIYKIPKRQHHQQRRSFNNVEFLSKFCTPVTVSIERLNLEDTAKKRGELVDIVKDMSKYPVEEVQKQSNLRSSPRLRH